VSFATRRWAAPTYALALAVAVTAPLLAPGYLLLRDGVSTPRSYLSDDALGLSESAPRALPQDFAVALGSDVVDGGALVKALLIIGIWLAGWGAARLAATVVPDAGLPGEFVAATLAIWNPYVAERLLQGHWSLLVGYGALPWVATAMIRLRSGSDRRAGTAWWSLIFWIALAGLTPTGLMLAATVALVCVATPGKTPGRGRWVCVTGTLAVAVVVAVPWLTAAALGTAPSSPPDPGVAAFAARAEPGLATLGSLASLGGIWNAEAVPASRATPFALVAAAVLLGIVAAGLPSLWRRPIAVALLTLSVASVLIAAAMATSVGQSVVVAILRELPLLGVVRDGQKWVALAVPGYALAAAAAVLTLRRWLYPALTALACCAALLGVLPDLAWGAGGQVVAVRYPPGWAAVAATINADPRPVAVLPTGSIRRFVWSRRAPVLDPLPRWVRARVLSSGDLTISGHSVPGEGAHARDVERELLIGSDAATLARSGVGWVVVESGTLGDTGKATATLDRLPVVYRDGSLTLYRAGGDQPGASRVRRALMVSAHLVWLAALLAGAAGMAVTAVRNRASTVVGV
jgi:hypothetical protein